MDSSKGIKRRKTASLLLAGTLMFSGVLQVMPSKASADSIAFNTQSGGIFDGMPLFDGVPSHLDAFVDTYFNYVGLEGAALYATGIRDNYTFVMDDNPIKGKTVPGGIAAADNVYGVSTDFPALVGLGQSWNKGLLTQVGQVMGSEKISQNNVKQGTANIHNGSNASKPIAFTALSDLRINPLNGRFPEGYGEDPYLSATMIDNMAAGLSGTDQNESDNGFWIRAIVGTKHFSMYNAEWFRQSSSTAAGARAIYEYQTPSAFKGLESGSVSGIMTSFGRTNGIPNIISPYMILGDKVARYGMYSSPDFNGEQHLYNASFGNGYDTQYTLDRKHALALMVLGHSESVRASGTDKTDVVTLANAVKEGLYGITLQDVRDAGRPLVNQLVRAGIFNETGANGIPKYYPFASQAKDVSSNLTSFNTQAHQEVALQAARETVVLLKNTDGALPLDKTKKAAVVGAYADMRMKAQYSASTPSLPTAGKTPLFAILSTIGASKVQFNTGGEVIALKSKANGKYVTAGTAAGAQLTADYSTSDNTFTNAQLFEVYDWGQQAASLLSKENSRWVTAPTTNNAAVGNTATANLLLTGSDWSNPTSVSNNSTIPAKLRIEGNSDNSVSIISGGLAFQTGVYSGRYVTTAADGKMATGAAAIGNPANYNSRGTDAKFEKTTVKEAGADAAALADTQDYALVFIGAHPSNSAAEGNDRADLYLGANDYKLVKNVAAAFAAKNKKTIVVLLASSPVIMEEIQNDPNVSAIVEQPYSGEFDAQGLTDVLYGDYAPTGRLTSTWYADMSALPAIDKYSIPEGSATTLSQIDPRYTVDMSNADPVETKLTYMYTSAPVTYPFGYGLGYADFTYKDFSAPSSASSASPFNVSVEITNEGSIATSEVVQLYARKNGSAYGAEAPQKKLVGYEKVSLTAGEHKVVTLTVDPKDLAIWDVNKGDYIVEDGSYSLMVGHSSDDIRFTGNITIVGDQLASLSAVSKFNVFDHAFASSHVAYSEASKARTVASLSEDKIAGEYYTVNSKQQGAWVALPKTDFTGAQKLVASVASNSSGGHITLRADSPANEPFATIEVPVTSVSAYTMPTAADQTVRELGFAEVEAAIDNAPAGLHTVYVVFDSPDIRIDTLQVTENELTISSPAANAVLPSAEVGAPYEQSLNLSAIGGTKPYAWSVTGLPEGLSFDPATGKITGTPAEGSDNASPYTVTITVTDANNTAIAVTNTLAVHHAGVLTASIAGASQVYSNAPFSLTVGLNHVSVPLLAQDIRISYDSSAIEFLNAESLVEGVSIVGTNTDEPGIVRILAVSEGPDHAVTAAGDVIKLNMKAKQVSGNRAAVFAIASAEFSDAATEIAAEAGDALSVQILYVNTQALLDIITEAQAFHDAAVEGTAVGQYPAGSKATLQAAIDAAAAVAAGAPTEQQVQDAAAALHTALQAFKQLVVTQVVGDVNGDNRISVLDLAQVSVNYGKTSQSADWSSIKRMDLNNDGVIDISDLAIIAQKILQA
ncbi:glycoside hydrolase family 3 C-terminal domain-containing protein [Paenibacillus sp. BK720]|uniref:glycoside hydrolase family 3 C-terminal domain-containing protein n=1 Tax=Paenibacillus sp. BK720 TaxID=2587092 RepID=UPI001421C5E7|nr:glycoside hydrolase family 3 C-terminal domain-containing protein [Paenibacillus sp. BK720]NIK70948.1 beta-glucosidase-like glycosyl hydrolase [Paenibacillus sp. BK720]